ncbi:MAG: signal peptide peptidase SppA [Paramuribaculum sp.]|nr:signal peptide peptidase SppA [Paramuribaculum sp.]
MKNFFLSLLGALAAIWLSALIGFFIFAMIVGGIVASSFSSDTPAKVEKHSILHLTLEGMMEDRESPREFSMAMFNDEYTEPMSLEVLGRVIRQAANDDNIEGIFLDCKGLEAGMAQIEALSKVLKEFKESGKWIYSYSDGYAQGDYILASVSDTIFLNPVGMVDIHGLQSQVLFFKNLLDKLGVEMQVVKVGTYKSAVEPFILDHMSEANHEQISLFLNQIWGKFANEIAENRSVTVEQVNAWANSSLFAAAAEKLVEEKVVDRLVYRREIDDILAKLSHDDEPRLISYTDYAKSNPAKQKKHQHEIAVLYALGDITESDKTGIASERLVPEIIKLAKDDDVEGLVLRVNSGGGSAFASEQIWEALEYFKSTGKPFYVSMGDYAASGGYYISCGAEKIYAEPVTLTGSIGIFGLIPNLKGLITDKIGINMASVSTNSGDLPTLFAPMTPQQRAAMQSSVDRGYELFTSRCAEGRHTTVDSIKAIAEGRVWDGMTAQKIGLVDELGGLDEAVAALALKLGYSKGEYYTTAYPDVKLEWWEEIYKMSGNIRASIIDSHLGDAKEYYDAMREFENWDNVQARMVNIRIN